MEQTIPWYIISFSRIRLRNYIVIVSQMKLSVSVTTNPAYLPAQIEDPTQIHHRYRSSKLNISYPFYPFFPCFLSSFISQLVHVLGLIGGMSFLAKSQKEWTLFTAYKAMCRITYQGSRAPGLSSVDVELLPPERNEQENLLV